MINNPQVGDRVCWIEFGTIVEISNLPNCVLVRDDAGRVFVWTLDHFYASREDAADKLEQEASE